MSYVHRHLPAEGCWTVGHYDGGDWEPVSDHDTEQAAAAEAARLNGCPAPARGTRAVIDALARLHRDDLARMNDADLLALRGNLAAWHALTDLEDHNRQQARARRVDGCRLEVMP